ncbi:MAG: hypothetical protein JWO82_1281 [Akkermansiaceae bacterium]|nr:hypothetical protein [Akkermansiaceae bacterium]
MAAGSPVSHWISATMDPAALPVGPMFSTRSTQMAPARYMESIWRMETGSRSDPMMATARTGWSSQGFCAPSFGLSQSMRSIGNPARPRNPPYSVWAKLDDRSIHSMTTTVRILPFVMLLLASCAVPGNHSSAHVSVAPGRGAGSATPRGAARKFIATLFTSKRDLLRDGKFRANQLSSRLDLICIEALRRYEAKLPHDPYDHTLEPGNGNGGLFGAWCPPTTFEMKQIKAGGDRAAAEVVYHWGPGTQYAGDSRRVTVLTVRENGRWYVDDLHNHKGKFNSEFSLSQTLSKD